MAPSFLTSLLDDPIEAGRWLRAGKLVGFPTETVYGLGANIFNSKSLERLYEAKGRPSDNPLIVHIADVSQLSDLVSDVPPAARLLVDQFWPGPLTIVLPKQAAISDQITAGLPTVAVRCPSMPITRQVLASAEVPIAAPSANRSGKPSATTWEAVIEDLDGRIDAVLRGPAALHGLESTVVDCTSSSPRLLRAGGITVEQLQLVIPDLVLPEWTTKSLQSANSPGLRHKHYQPRAKVLLFSSFSQVKNDAQSALICVGPSPVELQTSLTLNCVDIQQYAQELYEFFRKADRANLRYVYCQAVEPTGLGKALMDRLSRASE